MVKTTIGISKKTKKKLHDFKDFIESDFKESVSDDKFVNFLIETHPQYLNFVQTKMLRQLKDEWLNENLNEVTESFEDFKKRKLKEGLLKNG